MKDKKNILKISFVFAMMLIILISNNLTIRATDSVFEGADNFLNSGNDKILNTDSILETADNLFTVFTVFGTCLILIVGAILGIKFIMASAQGKAEIKESLTPYIIGAVVIFGAYGIWFMFLNIFKKII